MSCACNDLRASAGWRAEHPEEDAGQGQVMGPGISSSPVFLRHSAVLQGDTRGSLPNQIH